MNFATKSPITLAGTVLLVVAAVGCGASEATDTSTDAPAAGSPNGIEDPAPAVADQSLGTLPSVDELPAEVDVPELGELSITAATGYTPIESAQVMTASHTLIEDCMSDQGLKYSFTPPSPSAAIEEQNRRLGVMMFNDVDALAARGYDALLPDPTAPDVSEVGDVSVAPDEATQAALADCQTVSDLALNPDGAQAGTNQVSGAQEAEEAMNIKMFEVLSAEGQLWSECMSRNGITDAKAGSIPQQVARNEVASSDAALFDAECRVESGYTDRLLSFRAATVADFLAANATEMANVEVAREIEVANANQVLIAHGLSVD